MSRAIIGFILIISTYLGVDYFWNHKVHNWKILTREIVESAQEAGLDQGAWREVGKESKKLPNFFPFSTIKNIFPQVDNIFTEIHEIKEIKLKFNENFIELDRIWSVFDKVRNIKKSVNEVSSDIVFIPSFLLAESEKQQKEELLKKLDLIKEQIDDLLKFESTLKYFEKEKERILVLLQNQNEPRSTGGFTGSIIIMDFEENKISWRFSDIYAIDRKIKESDQLDAPEFFHGLSNKISLRDANFWPDFPTTAKWYRHFFDKADERVPDTIIGINLNVIEEILKITGPVKFKDWGMSLDEYNFDLVLQFLIESKITGRYNVKKPVELFANEIFKKLDSSEKYNIAGLSDFDWKKFIDEKNILANSKNHSLQKLFEKWRIAGKMQKQKEADNFLYFDFISIGANKSDKFVWTKIWHDSQINRGGTVKNFIKIKRTHALKSNEIKDLLGFDLLSENIKNLLNTDILWKLGAGENRIIMRMYLPKTAKLISQNIPIKDYIDDDTGFRIFEFPMNVLPSENLAVKIEYETNLKRGSHDWRPYFLEVLGTAGREKTSFLETISTTDNGKFSAETLNIGHPEPLIDQEYRVVVEWEEKVE